MILDDQSYDFISLKRKILKLKAESSIQQRFFYFSSLFKI